MATIRFFSAFNMLQAQDWDWEATQATATSLVIQDLTAGKKQTFTGTFTYEGDLVSGNTTGTAFYENNVLVYRVSGMAHDATTLQMFANASGDTQETYAFVLSGNDTLTGSDADDTLLGYTGNDKIDGGAGGDDMLGGAGNDIYEVDNALDRVFETTTRGSGIDAGGNDVVRATANFKLGDFIERLVLNGDAAIKGTGNSMDNVIVGNAAANTLMGAAGADALVGGGGNDRLGGGVGKDTMTGGAGADTFDYNAVTDSGPARETWDVIKDFVQGEDKIDLSTMDANPFVDGNQAFSFGGLGMWGVGEAGVGKLRYEVLAAGVVVYGNVDMDADADFSIFLAGLDLVANGDFVL